MRRKDREIQDMAEIMEILKRGSVCTVGFQGYAVSLFNSNELWSFAGGGQTGALFPWRAGGDEVRAFKAGSPCVLYGVYRR